MKKKSCLVVGAGAFGTSIANVLANNFDQVILKVRSQDIYQGLKNNRENAVYLKGHKVSEKIIPALTWEEVDQLTNNHVDLLVNGLPTQSIKTFFNENFDRFNNYFKKGIPLVSLSKGIDSQTLELPDDIFNHYFGQYDDLLLYLSGPSYAEEILEEQITLVSLAGKNKQILESVSKMLESHYFKVMLTYDVKGVLLGGALKNILAIAGGILEGLGYNHNTRAAMVTTGIHEMLRFGIVYNARPETFYGLSGMGDLILTVTGNLSRNKLFGMEIAKGRSPEDIINSQRMVIEGYKTTQAAFQIAEKFDIRARITRGLYSVLYQGRNPREVIKELMQVPSRFEIQ